MGHVVVITTHGTEMLVSWPGKSYIDGASLRERVSEAFGYDQGIVQLHYCSSNPDGASKPTVTRDDTLLPSGSRVHLVLPVVFRTRRVEGRNKVGVRRKGGVLVRAARPYTNAFCPPAHADAGARVVEGMRAIAKERGWDFEAMERAVALVRRCALRTRATRGLAGMRIGAQTLQRLSRAAIVPSFDVFRAVQLAIDEAEAARLGGVAAGTEVVRSLGCFAQTLLAACTAVRHFSGCVRDMGELLGALAESEAALEGCQQALRDCVKGGSQDWQRIAAERDEKRTACVECGRKVASHLVRIRAQEEECEAAQARVVSAYYDSDSDLVSLFGYQAFGAVDGDRDMDSARDVESGVMDASQCAQLVVSWEMRQGAQQRDFEAATLEAQRGLWGAVGSANQLVLGVLRQALESAVNESSWYAVECAIECQQACEPLISTVHGLFHKLGSVRSSLEACDPELTRLDVQLPEWERAEAPLHRHVHQRLEEIRVLLSEVDDDDRYEAAESRVTKLAKKQKKGEVLTEEETEKLQEARTVLQEKRSRVQALHRQQRALFAELAVLADRHFPEIPLVFPGQPLIKDLFQHDVAKLFVPGRSLEDYTVVRTLSVTPKSRHNVFQAELDGETCALKEYNLDSDFSVKTLQHELAILSGLDHPCILKVRCFFLDEARAYVELPLCNEGNVEEWVSQTKPPPSSVHAALHQILRPVEYLHARDIVHCDIRCANVLVQTDEQGLFQVFLSDFDISISLKRICTRASTMSSTGMRGFDGQLSMAPEVRKGGSCSASSDMFSFGGLAFILVLREYCLAHGSDCLPPGDSTVVAIPAFSDGEFRHLISLLLCVDPGSRISAAYAMTHPYFSSSGALARHQARQQLEELARRSEELEEERSAARSRFQEEEERARCVRDKLAAKMRANDQQRRQLEKQEEAVRAKLDKHKRELEQQRADLEKKKKQDAEVMRRKDREAGEKLKEIQAKKAEVLRKQKELQRDSTLPHFWSISSDPPGGFEIVPVSDRTLLASLQKFLNSDRVGGGGRDQAYKQRYSSLSLERAWRIENPIAWRSYMAAKKRIMSVRGQGLRFPRLNVKTDAASRELRGGVDADINEKRLLHGSWPDHILSLVRNGFNERFAGSGAGSWYGKGNYFAEDSAKADIYVMPHTPEKFPELRRTIYSSDKPHPGGEIFYLFVCKVVLGVWLRVESTSQMSSVLHTTKDGKVNPRELKAIDGISPMTPHHSLHARIPHPKFQEFVVFHGDQVFAEYLLAYKRK